MLQVDGFWRMRRHLYDSWKSYPGESRGHCFLCQLDGLDGFANLMEINGHILP